MSLSRSFLIISVFVCPAALPSSYLNDDVVYFSTGIYLNQMDCM
jgi:hypothetical protein